MCVYVRVYPPGRHIAHSDSTLMAAVIESNENNHSLKVPSI